IPATNQLVEHDFSYRYKAAGVKAIVCTADGDVSSEAEKAAQDFPDLLKIMVGGEKAGWHDFNVEMERFSTHYHRSEATPSGDDPMLMVFTSGTTGYPRIATHSYKYALGHYPTAKHWHNVNPNGLHFTISDTGWGKAFWGKLYGQWLCEAAVFTYDFDRFRSEDILPMFAKYGITTFCAPPTMYRFFIKEDLSKYDLSSIEYATTAGEALNPEVFSQFKKATGLTIMEGFGQTETTLSIANFVGSTPRIGSMGRPSPLYDVVLLDADGNECKTGDVGEICIRTKNGAPCGLFIGYYRDEEKTREAWHDGYYHTGDQATMDEDGYLWYVGRIDDVIKSSGYRIGPFEIESVIMELPYVLECAITPVPDEVRGQIVKATIVLVKGTVGTEALKKEIQEYVKTHTAPYKYPRIVEFVSELPKTISGKIRRVEIRKNDLEKVSK
ncbi:MAG: AMP-binding protein, partial [Clostridia bacterium]|nr:AMP-binding protein [Clostridia bacterium]